MVLLVLKCGCVRKKSFFKIMFLQPKRSKYKKTRKGTLPKLEFRANKLRFYKQKNKTKRQAVD
jgi:hypothetical protein